jgi:hypothetical protein
MRLSGHGLSLQAPACWTHGRYGYENVPTVIVTDVEALWPVESVATSRITCWVGDDPFQ